MPVDRSAFVRASGGRKPPVGTINRGLTPPARPDNGYLVAHPRSRAYLTAVGITTAADALALPGEVVCGHPDRHVVRVELGAARRVAYLKREHVVGWRVRLRNALAGYGWVSRAEREARCVRRLERLGLPGPRWLAYGADGTGRAFLLVDGLTGHTELRHLLAAAMSPADRRELAVRLGRAIADLHDAGFDTPDLSAKHVFVRPGSLLPTLIDWQSARERPGDRVRALATLTATVADNLATPRDRLRVLWAYRRSVWWSGGRPRFGELARRVAAESRAIADRSSVREQRMSGSIPDQRLVWLAGDEAVCVRPDLAADWPTPAVCEPFYAPDAPTGPVVVRDPGRGLVSLTRFRSAARPGWLDRLLGRPWRSPGVTLARTFFHLERYGVPVPRLLAFGQRRVGSARGDSFVLADTGADAIAFRAPAPRRALFEAGVAVRAMHDANCRFGRTATAADVVRIAGGRVLLDPTRGIRKVRSVRPAARVRDLRTLLHTLPPGFTRADRLRVLTGYHAGDADARTRVRATARRTLGGRPAR